jgi:hypothetical protein
VKSPAHRTITVSVRVDGRSGVGGTVTVYNGRGIRLTKKLRHGTAQFSPKWLRAGDRRFTVIYSGSYRAEPRTVVRTVSVR